MVNVIPPDLVDDVHVVEQNQHDGVRVVPKPVLVDEDEDPEEDEFEEEDDMEVDIEEDENEPELTYPYEEVDHLNPPPPAFKSEPKDAIEVENLIEHEDKSVPACVYEVGESSTATFLREDSDGLLPSLMRRDINSLFGRWLLFQDNCVVVRRRMHCVEQGTDAMERLVEKLGNAEDMVECKKMKKELEEARVQAHEFYQEMIRRGFVFEERPNDAINVSIEDEKSPSSEPQGSPHDA
nr:hypothetical protein [Tanacetum cinerariifolium]